MGALAYTDCVTRLARPSRRVEITVPVRTLIVAALVVVSTWAVVSIREALILVFIGVFMALVFEHPTRLLMRKAKLSRTKAAVIVVLGSIVVVSLLALLLLVPLVGALRDFVKDLPTLMEDLRGKDELSWLGDSGVGENAQDGAESLAGSFPDSIGAILGAAGNAFAFALSLFTMTFLALYLLIDMPRLQRVARSMLEPLRADRVIGIWERVTTTVSYWAIGAGTIAVIAGTVQGGTAFLLGSSYWLALGLIAGFLDLIPNIGATIATVILVAVVWAEEGTTDAIIMLVVGLVYQQFENSVLSPTIYGKATDISPFLVILGVTVFGALLGVLGALVAVPVTASLQIVAAEITRARRERIEAMAAPAEQAEPPPESAPPGVVT